MQTCNLIIHDLIGVNSFCLCGRFCTLVPFIMIVVWPTSGTNNRLVAGADPGLVRRGGPVGVQIA